MGAAGSEGGRSKGGGAGPRRGGGFVSGALTALALSAAAAAALSLSAPPRDGRSAAPAPGGEAAAPATVADGAGALDGEPGSRAAPSDPARVEAESQQAALPVADAQGPEGSAARSPVSPPPEPAWRRNAATLGEASAGDAASVAVALDGLRGWDGLAQRATALGVASFVVDPLAPGAAALARAAREAGAEVIAAGGPLAADRDAGFLARSGSAPAGAADAGMLALRLVPGAAAGYDGGPALAADLVLEGSPDAAAGARALLALQAARPGPGGLVIYAVADDATLTALARWKAASGLSFAPLTALAARDAE